jgi:PAS domain S-box-containing protein
MDDLHTLLKRQLKRHFGANFVIPPEWRDFINSIDAAYGEFDSDRRMMERSLELSSEELVQANAETRSIIQLFPDAFLWLDQDGTILSYKSSGENSLKWLEGILAVGHIQNMKPRDVQEILDQAINRSIKTRQTSSVKFFIGNNSQTKHYEARVIPPLARRILVVIRDVTEQRVAEESVQESQRRFFELSNMLPVGTFEANLKMELSYFNKLAFDLLEYSEYEVLGNSILNFIAAEDQERSLADLQKAMSGENIKTNEYTAVKKNGSHFPILIQTMPIKNKQCEITGIRGIIIDISTIKKIEKKLLESEEKYRSLVQNIKLGIFRTEPIKDGRLIEFNNTMEEITGYSRDELTSIAVAKLYAISGEREEFIKQLDLNPEKASLTTNMIRKDGSVIIVNMIAKAVKDKTGRIKYIDGTIEDITERKKMEERILDLYEKEKKQREVLQEEAKARGMFIDVLAHELRTPLTPILASSGMLQDISNDETDIIRKKLINNIFVSTQTMTSRLEELLDLARYSRGTFRLHILSTEVIPFIQGVVSRFKPSLVQRKQQLIEEIPETAIEADIDPSRVEQVILNLLSNASKFSPEHGKIVLKVSLENCTFRVDVKDYGIGISQQAQQRLFEPYHRVEQDRQQFPGLGLGLAVSRQIVEAHNGKIWLVSHPEEGSVFSFQIPLKQHRQSSSG